MSAEAGLAELLEFLRAVNRSQNLAEVGAAVLRYAISLVPGAQSGSLLILNEGTGAFEFRAAVGWDLAKLSPIKIPKDKALQSVCFQDRPAIVRDPYRLNREHLGEELASALEACGPCAAFLSLPIRDEGEVIGYLNLDNREDPDAFSAEDFPRLGLVWEEITLAVRQARAREHRAESEQLFRFLFERLADAVYITAFDGTILASNPAASRQTGYTQEELVGMNIIRDIAGGEPAVTYETVNEQLRRGETVMFEEKKRRKDGTIYWTECAVVQLDYRGGLAALSVNRDITARKKAEEDLRRREAILEAVSFAAESLLEARNLDEAMGQVLARLGKATGVSRVYIFENHVGPDGRPLASQRYEWAAPGITPQIANPQLQNFPYLEAGFVRWAEMLSRGEVVLGLVEEFPESERPILRSQEILSIAVVPILSGGEWWGFMGFDDCWQRRPWSSADVEALRAAAGVIGSAIERHRAEEELRALFEVALALGATLDLEDLFSRIYTEVSRLIPCDAFTIALVDPRKGEFRLEFAVEAGDRLPKLVRPLDPEASLTAWVATAKAPLLIRDYQAEKDRLPAVAQQVGREVASWLGVPLLFPGEVLGVMSVQAFRPQAFGETELRLLQTVAGAVGVAIRNARTYKEQKDLEAKLRAVEQASQRMKLAANKEELYGAALAAVTEVLGYSRASILEPQEGGLTVVAHRGYAPLREGKPLFLPWDGPGITVETYRQGEEIYVPDVTPDPRYVVVAQETRSELALPIRLGERKFGVLNVEHPEVDGILPEDWDLLRIVAAELAVALAGLERLQAIQDLSEKLAALHKTVQRLQRCSTIEECAAVAVEEASQLLGFTICNVGLVEGEWLVPKASSEEARGVSRTFRRGEGLAWKTFTEGRARWGNIEDFPEARPVRTDLRSFISVPIGDFGVFQAASTTPNAYSPEDVLLTELLAGHLREEFRRIKAEEELREQAIRDPLTGLYNRRFLLEALGREIERARRYGHVLALLMIDLDNFCRVNNLFGHTKGDEALREIAKLFLSNVRAADMVFRYGGDEFVILLPETDGRAAEVASRLREVVRKWSREFGLGFEIGLSTGITLFQPEDERGMEELLEEADRRMYEEKRRRPGRG